MYSASGKFQLLLPSLQYDQLEQYVPRYLVYCLIWAFAGDAKMKSRYEMGDFIRGVTTIPLPSPSSPVLDYEVNHTLVSVVKILLPHVL